MRYLFPILVLILSTTTTATAQNVDVPPVPIDDIVVNLDVPDDPEQKAYRGLGFLNLGVSGGGDTAPQIGLGVVFGFMPHHRHGFGVYAGYNLGGTLETDLMHTVDLQVGYLYRGLDNDVMVSVTIGDTSIWRPGTHQVSDTGVVGQGLAVWKVAEHFSLGGRLFFGVLWDLEPDDPDLEADPFLYWGGGVVMGPTW